MNARAPIFPVQAANAVRDASGFLLEDLAAPGLYFGCTHEYGAGSIPGEFMRDRDKALRFARREDAEKFAKAFLPNLTSLRVVEFRFQA